MKWKKTIAAATVSALVLGTCAGYENVGKKKASASELFSTEEILAPVWEGNVSYQESVLAVEEEDGSLAPVSLLYPIGEIVSVKSASLLVAYEAEKDYSVRDGKLVIKKDGAIPFLLIPNFTRLRALRVSRTETAVTYCGRKGAGFIRNRSS